MEMDDTFFDEYMEFDGYDDEIYDEGYQSSCQLCGKREWPANLFTLTDGGELWLEVCPGCAAEYRKKPQVKS